VAVLDQSLFRFVWRHSRREQVAILLLIVASLPFYWVSLEIPKRIINDVLQGRAFEGGRADVPLSHVSPWLPEGLFGAMRLDQMELLFVLSAVYLSLVLANGAFKYVINLRKGVLGERMLRRLRYELLARFLRFRPEEARAAKPAEIASMIKDEVEPIGGFIGDAFIQPAFLGAQAATAMLFILVQNVWLGLVAFAIVAVQSVVIPYLRREQVRLARERQIASRKLAGRIGEIVEGAPAILTHGTAAYNQAEVGTRLGGLFNIRTALFKRKFAVKFLNNLLSQITPFLFFAVGGYFALHGSLDIGQLVAVIAAYRDLPPPIKELIDWDQQRSDVAVKYQQITTQFAPERYAPFPLEDDSGAIPAPTAPLRIEGLQVVDRFGTTLLETATSILDRPGKIALVGPAGSGRGAFARALGRQISEYKGAIRLGDSDLAALSNATAGRVVSFCGAEPCLFQGSIRDNILFSLYRKPPARGVAQSLSKSERALYAEAEMSGNLVIGPCDDWTDYQAAGVADADALDRHVFELLAMVGLHDDVYRLGLRGRLEPDADPSIIDRLVTARQTITARLRSRDLERYVEPFDPTLYNANATIRENLLFGAFVGETLSDRRLAADPVFRAQLEDHGLLVPLLVIGQSISRNTIEMFGGLPPGDPLFERYSLIRFDEMDDYKALLAASPEIETGTELDEDGQGQLLRLALSYIEPRHRFRLLDGALRDKIVAARRAVREVLETRFDVAIEFYEPQRVMRSASIRDNLLFGRLAFDLPDAEQKVWHVIRGVLSAIGLEETIYRLGLDHEVGPGGKHLDGRQRTAIDLVRCLIKRPDVLIIDGALQAFERSEAARILAGISAMMQGRTLIVGLSDEAEAHGFDRVVLFDGPRLTTIRVSRQTQSA
jgi:putative ABC transport system ATP-binding protein